MSKVEWKRVVCPRCYLTVHLVSNFKQVKPHVCSGQIGGKA